MSTERHMESKVKQDFPTNERRKKKVNIYTTTTPNPHRHHTLQTTHHNTGASEERLVDL